MSICEALSLILFRPATVSSKRGFTSFWQSVGIQRYRFLIASHASKISPAFMRSMTVLMVLISTDWYVGRIM